MSGKEAALGWCYLLAYMFLIPWLLSYGNILLPAPLSDAKINFLFFLINFLSVGLIGWRFFLHSGKPLLALPFRCLKITFLSTVIYFISNFLISLLILKIRPDFANVNDSSIANMTEESFLLMGIGTVLLAPPVEEFLYRGLLFGSLHSKSRFAAYLVSTVVFAAIHVMGYLGHYDLGLLLLCFLQYLPAGLCLAWAYERSDTIWVPVLMHIAINQIGMQAMR